VTAPARSVFAEPLAQARDALTGGHSGRTAQGLAALDRIEQRATDMETALRDLDELAQAWLKADTFDGLGHRERRRVAHARARMVADRIADVLSAREEAQT